jgi:autotransporter-associated beta strand protein
MNRKTNSVKRSILAAACATALGGAGSAWGATWTGLGANDNWGTAANWDVAPNPGDALTFAGTVRLTPSNNLALDTAFGPTTFDSSAGSFTLVGNRITLNGDVVNSSGNAQTINLAMILNANRNVQVDGGNVTINGVLSGAGGALTKTGVGVLTLGAANTYTGPTTIDGGTLAYTVDNTAVTMLSFGTVATASTASANVGTLDLTNANLTVTALTAQTNSGQPNLITIGAGKTLTVNGVITVGVNNAFSEVTAATNTVLNVTGNSMVVNAGSNSSAIGVGRSNATGTPGADPVATLNLSADVGLNNFTYIATGAGELRVGGGNVRGTLTLATGSNTITASQIRIGDTSVSGAGNNNPGGRSAIHLGAGSNVLNTNTLIIGETKGSGMMDFLASNGTLTLRGAAGGTSTVNIQVGSANNATGSSDEAQLFLAGHDVNVQAGNVVLGRLAGGSGGSPRGNLTFDTGTFTASSIQLGVNSSGNAANGAVGILTIGGPSAGNTAATGVLTVTNQFFLANRTSTATASRGSVGTFTINGGTANILTDILDASTTISTNSANITTLTLDGGTLNMNGKNIGTFAAPITNINLNSGTFNGAATISGRQISVSGPTMTGAPNYLVADAGSLTAFQDLHLTSGGGLGGGGSSGASVLGNVIADSGSRIAPGFGTTAGTLNFNNDLTLNNNSALAFKLGATHDVGNGVNDLIVVSGTLSFTGTQTITISGLNGGPTAGTYRLINFSNPSTISGTNFTVLGQTRQAFTLDASTAGQLNVLVGAGGAPLSLTWRGGANGLWNLATDFNWVNPSLTPDRFFASDTVTFDDTATNPGAVTLVGALSPASVTVNASRNYTFGATGLITGTTGLNKIGTGTLIIANGGVNDYSGGTTNGAGSTLQIGNGSATGNVPGAIANDGTLVFNRSDAITQAGVLSGAGNVVIRSGTVTLSGINTYTGTTTVTNGAVVRVSNATINAGGGSSLGAGTAAAVTVLSGGVLDLSANATANQLNFGQKPFFVEGTGIGGAGVIVNTGVAQQNALQRVTLTGDATFGGSQRYDIRAPQDTNGATIVNTASLDLQGHTLTKIGTNQFSLVAVNVSESGNIVVNSGTFSAETSTLMGGTNTVTLNDGTTMQFFSNIASVSTITRPMVFNGNVRTGSASAGNTNGVHITTIGSNILLNGNVSVGISNNVLSLFRLTGVISETGGARSLTKTGLSVFYPDAANTYTGPTTISGGTVNATILANGGVASSIGQSSLSASNLVIAGGAMLGYTGSNAATTDRLMTFNAVGGTVAATLDASGGTGAPVVFSNTGVAAVTGANPLLVSFGGSNTDANTFTPVIQNGAGAAVVSVSKIGAGNWTLAGQNTYSGTTVVNAGTLRVSGSIANSAGLTVATGATYEAASTQTVKSITTDSGFVNISNGPAKRVLTVGNNTATNLNGALSLANSAKVDLNSNALVVDYAPGNDAAVLGAVRGQILTAYNPSSPGAGDGNWNGPSGITSSSAAADPNGKGVGYALSSDILGAGGGSFMGVSVDGSSVIARYTLLGDATLDGQVNFNDLVQLAQSYNVVDGSRTWFLGDFTYDGNTDFNDLVKLAQNYNTALPTEPIPGASATFEADLSAAFASVPEPGAPGLIAFAACGLAGRRRRRRSSR